MKYNNYEITKDWKQATLDPYTTVVFNPQDTKQAFSVDNATRASSISSLLGDSFAKLGDYYQGTGYETNEGQQTPEEKAARQKIREFALSPQDYAVQQASLRGATTDELNAINKNSQIGNQLGALGNTNVQTGNVGNTNNLANQYQALLGQSPEEQAAQKAIDDQNNAFRTGTQNIGEQPIGMQFIAGQQADLEKRNVNLQIPLQQQLANAQEKRRASLDAIKFQLDRADTETARQDKLGAQQLDENYRRDTLEAEQKQVKTSSFQDASGNQVLINSQTGEVIKNLGGGTLDTTNKTAVKAFQQANGLVVDGIAGPKTLAKMAEKGITPSGKTGSGTPTVTEQKNLLTQTLNTGVAPNGTKIGPPRGSDGYVAPEVYIEAFKQWTGTPQQFMTAFPVKSNVNPLSYQILPEVLKQSVAGTSDNPY